MGDSLNYNRNNFSSSLQSVINKFNWSVITLLSCDLLLDIFHIRLSQILEVLAGLAILAILAILIEYLSYQVITNIGKYWKYYLYIQVI